MSVYWKKAVGDDLVGPTTRRCKVVEELYAHMLTRTRTNVWDGICDNTASRGWGFYLARLTTHGCSIVFDVRVHVLTSAICL